MNFKLRNVKYHSLNQREIRSPTDLMPYKLDIAKMQLITAHTGNYNDDDKNPEDHIQVKVASAAAAAAVVIVAKITHFSNLLSPEDTIYYAGEEKV